MILTAWWFGGAGEREEERAHSELTSVGSLSLGLVADLELDSKATEVNLRQMHVV